MMRLPCTRTRGLGVLSVIGTMREPKPAAMNTTRFTRYGSSAASPASVIRPDSTKPRSASSATTRLTVPTETESEDAISRCVSAPPPRDSSSSRTLNSRYSNSPYPFADSNLCLRETIFLTPARSDFTTMLVTRMTSDTNAAHSVRRCVSRSVMSRASGMSSVVAKNATAEMVTMQVDEEIGEHLQHRVDGLGDQHVFDHAHAPMPSVAPTASRFAFTFPSELHAIR